MEGGAPGPPSPPLSEEEQFELLLALDQSDLKIFRRVYAAPRMGCAWVIALLAGYVATGAAAFQFGPLVGRHANWDETVATVVVAVVGLLILDCARRLAFPLRAAIDTDQARLVTMIDGLWLLSKDGERVYAWGDLKGMIVSDAAIYLGLDNRSALMLPARVFDGRDDFHTFVSIVAKYAHI